MQRQTEKPSVAGSPVEHRKAYMTRLFIRVASASLALQMIGCVVVQAAEIKVLGAVGMREVMLDLGPRFEHATGHTLAMTFDASGVIVRRIESGETVDVIMILGSSLERLRQEQDLTGLCH
jgi:ABC-type molybdate transport system substrate-binding protein